MKRDRLLLETISDLRQRVERPQSEYELLGAAGLLRLLLLDQHPLLSLAGKAHGFKPCFRVTWPVEPMPIGGHLPVFWASMEGLSPRWHPHPNPGVMYLRRDGFLALEILWVRTQHYTVKDLMGQAAHIEGGVHAGDPKSDKEQVLSRLAEGFRVGGASPVTRSLRGIGAVVLDAAEPLGDRLRAS